MNIFTENLLLRKLTPEDVSLKYLSWFDDPLIVKFIQSKPSSLEILQEFIKVKNSCANVLMLGIFSRENSSHIGNLKFEPISFDSQSAVLGIMIGDKNMRGKGFAGEAIVASCRYLHDHYKVNHFNLGVSNSNLSAIRAYEKIGFKTKFVDTDNGVLHMSLEFK